MTSVRPNLALVFEPAVKAPAVARLVRTGIVLPFPSQDHEPQGPFLTVSQRQYLAQMGELRRVQALDKWDPDYAIKSQPFWPEGYDV